MAKQVTMIAAPRAHGALKKRAMATAANTIPVSMFAHPQPVIWKVYS